MDADKITEKLGITMSQMQRAAAAAIIQGSGNVEVLSPTGSGKTLAYLLPLAQLIDTKSDELQAVVIVRVESWPFNQRKCWPALKLASEVMPAMADALPWTNIASCAS